MPFSVRTMRHDGQPEPDKVENVKSVILYGSDGVGIVIEQNEQGQFQWHKTGQWHDRQPVVMG